MRLRNTLQYLSVMPVRVLSKLERSRVKRFARQQAVNIVMVEIILLESLTGLE